MSDPERLLTSGSDVDAKLLGAGLDEPPPHDLLERTLSAVGAAAPATAAATSGVAVKAGVVAAGAKSGILGAIAAGAIAGLVAVGGYEVTSSRSTPPPARVVPAVSAPVVTAAPREVEAPAVVKEAPAASASAAPVAPSTGPVRPSALAVEIALLDEARAALNAGDLARARSILDRYDREIAKKQMAREAALLRADVEAASAGKTIP